MPHLMSLSTGINHLQEPLTFPRQLRTLRLRIDKDTSNACHCVAAVLAFISLHPMLEDLTIRFYNATVKLQ